LAVGYLFARSYTSAFFRYFGVDIDVLAISNEAVAIRGLSVLWLILLAIFALSLLAGILLMATRRLPTSDDSRARRRFRLLWALVGVLAVSGAFGAYGNGGTPDAFYAALLLGFAAFWFSWHLGSKARAASVPSSSGGHRLFVLGMAGAVAMLLFALTSSIASSRGRDAARALSLGAAHFKPSVILDTRERLYNVGLSLPETALPLDSGQAFRYRYRGLVLLAAGSGKLVLIPSDWNPQTGFALVLPDDNQIRVQYLVRPPPPLDESSD
jgi:hypothetical protein